MSPTASSEPAPIRADNPISGDVSQNQDKHVVEARNGVAQEHEKTAKNHRSAGRPPERMVGSRRLRKAGPRTVSTARDEPDNSQVKEETGLGLAIISWGEAAFVRDFMDSTNCRMS